MPRASAHTNCLYMYSMGLFEFDIRCACRHVRCLRMFLFDLLPLMFACLLSHGFALS